MAIAVELNYHGSGATQATYDQVLSELGVSPGGSHPDPACMFHWMAPVPGGFRVVDVWESREKFDRFAAETIGPLGERLGMRQPQMNFFELHSVLT
jgi:uncharacterized membrane-anchored protein